MTSTENCIFLDNAKEYLCPNSHCKLMLVAPTVTQEYVLVTCRIGTLEPQTLITEPLINECNGVSSFL